MPSSPSTKPPSRSACSRRCRRTAPRVLSGTLGSSRSRVISGDLAGPRLLARVWRRARRVARARAGGHHLGEPPDEPARAVCAAVPLGVRADRAARALRAPPDQRQPLHAGAPTETGRDAARCSEMQRDAARCGEVRRDVARCGEMRLEMRLEMCRDASRDCPRLPEALPRSMPLVARCRAPTP